MGVLLRLGSRLQRLEKRWIITGVDEPETSYFKLIKDCLENSTKILLRHYKWWMKLTRWRMPAWQVRRWRQKGPCRWRDRTAWSQWQKVVWELCIPSFLWNGTARTPQSKLSKRKFLELCQKGCYEGALGDTPRVAISGPPYGHLESFASNRSSIQVCSSVSLKSDMLELQTFLDIIIHKKKLNESRKSQHETENTFAV